MHRTININHIFINTWGVCINTKCCFIFDCATTAHNILG